MRFLSFFLILSSFLFAASPKITTTMSMHELNKLTASDGATDDNFGYSVAINSDSDTVVVGAYGDDENTGSAYIYQRNTAHGGLLEQVAKLTASDADNNDNFGISVAISGDTVVVGANKNNGSGSAYIYEKPNDGWVNSAQEDAKLTDSDAATGRFGYSVAISGDTVVVGAYGYYGGSRVSTAIVYIYEKPNNGWADSVQEDAKLTTSDAPEDAASRIVTISGDTVVLGVYAGNNYPIQGSAYIYEKPNGGWVDSNQEDAKITALDGFDGDNFGISVAISGDTIVVGASNGVKMDPIHPIGGAYNPGSAYIYEKPNDGWVDSVQEDAKLTASDIGEYNNFGISVAISDDMIVVGANKNNASGSAYFYEKPTNGWLGSNEESAKLLPSDGAEDDLFGNSVVISGDTIVVGAHNNNASGSAYVFKGGATTAINPAIIMYLLN